MSLDKKELNILKKKIVTVFAFFEHNVKDIYRSIIHMEIVHFSGTMCTWYHWQIVINGVYPKHEHGYV